MITTRAPDVCVRRRLVHCAAFFKTNSSGTPNAQLQRKSLVLSKTTKLIKTRSPDGYWRCPLFLPTKSSRSSRCSTPPNNVFLQFGGCQTNTRTRDFLKSRMPAGQRQQKGKLWIFQNRGRPQGNINNKENHDFSKSRPPARQHPLNGKSCIVRRMKFEIRTREKHYRKSKFEHRNSTHPEINQREKRNSKFEHRRSNSRKWKFGKRIIEHFHGFGEWARLLVCRL